MQTFVPIRVDVDRWIHVLSNPLHAEHNTPAGLQDTMTFLEVYRKWIQKINHIKGKNDIDGIVFDKIQILGIVTVQ